MPGPNPIDPISGARIGIDTVHAMIHEGRLFVASVFNTSLAPNDALLLRVSVPADTYPHFRAEVAGGGNTNFTIYESTGYFGGKEIIPVNRNRNSPNVARTRLFDNPKVGSPIGLIIIDGPEILPGGVATQGSGVLADVFEEFILRPETDYLCVLRNISTVPQVAGIDVAFYEH